MNEFSKNNEDLDEIVIDYGITLLAKSEEAYLMALEIINKPTIKYRTEGFCFFICNAWELLLKAHYIRTKNDITAINFKDNTNRSIGLSKVEELVFTSTSNPMRNNLSRIRELRNKSTHTVLPEYDFVFTSLFQRCISNYNSFFTKQFPNFPLNKDITAFVSLSQAPDGNLNPLSLNPEALMQLDILKNDVGSDEAINQTVTLKAVKKDADFTYSISKDSEEKVRILAVTKDHETLYPYRYNSIIEAIKDTIALSIGDNHGFTQNTFNKLCGKHNIKDDSKYCHKYEYYGSSLKRYSDATIDYVSSLYIEEVRKKDNN